jgi:hypothetical protein
MQVCMLSHQPQPFLAVQDGQSGVMLEQSDCDVAIVLPAM